METPEVSSLLRLLYDYWEAGSFILASSPSLLIIVIIIIIIGDHALKC